MKVDDEIRLNIVKALLDKGCTQPNVRRIKTKTGKVKAIANLGKRTDGSYWEDFNYAISPTEPGSTFKLATMMSLLEDKKVRLTDLVNLEGGTWHINGQTVYDAEQHGLYEATLYDVDMRVKIGDQLKTEIRKKDRWWDNEIYTWMDWGKIFVDKNTF